MKLEDFVLTVAQGDYYAAGLGKVAKWLVLGSTVGMFTTQNLAYMAGVMAGAVLFSVQVWWEWQRQRRRSYQDSEFHKFKLREQAKKLGLDTGTLKALQVSPDPDTGPDTVDLPPKAP